MIFFSFLGDSRNIMEVTGFLWKAFSLKLFGTYKMLNTHSCFLASTCYSYVDFKVQKPQISSVRAMTIWKKYLGNKSNFEQDVFFFWGTKKKKTTQKCDVLRQFKHVLK